MSSPPTISEGILLINKPTGKTSFSLVPVLRRRLGVQKIGHGGTLDPFASGVMVLFVGRHYTKQASQLLAADKEYIGRLKLGVTTDSYDSEGRITATNDLIPDLAMVEAVIERFQGQLRQTPPMFSAKKVGGKRLYELARRGLEVDRKEVEVRVHVRLLTYSYPFLDIHVECSKGTYIRSLAHDMGAALGCGAHLVELQRTRCGPCRLEDCLDGGSLDNPELDLRHHLLKSMPRLGP